MLKISLAMSYAVLTCGLSTFAMQQDLYSSALGKQQVGDQKDFQELIDKTKDKSKTFVQHMLETPTISHHRWSATASAAYDQNYISAADIDYVIQEYSVPKHSVLYYADASLKQELFNEFIKSVLVAKKLKTDIVKNLLLKTEIKEDDGYLYAGTGKRSPFGAALERGHHLAFLEILDVFPTSSEIFTHDAFVDIVKVKDENDTSWFGSTKDVEKKTTILEFLMRDNFYYLNDSYPGDLSIAQALLMHCQKRLAHGENAFPGSMIRMAAHLQSINKLPDNFNLPAMLAQASSTDGLNWDTIPGAQKVDLQKHFPEEYKTKISLLEKK